eukprot:496429_1
MLALESGTCGASLARLLRRQFLLNPSATINSSLWHFLHPIHHGIIHSLYYQLDPILNSKIDPFFHHFYPSHTLFLSKTIISFRFFILVVVSLRLSLLTAHLVLLLFCSSLCRDRVILSAVDPKHNPCALNPDQNPRFLQLPCVAKPHQIVQIIPKSSPSILKLPPNHAKSSSSIRYHAKPRF